MKPHSPLPYNSLPDLVTGFLRRGIAQGRWRSELPSEGELCRELQVSRSTLRKGLERAASEGWIVAGGRGRRHRIRKQSRKPRSGVAAQVVRLLSPHSVYAFGGVHHQVTEALADGISRAGFRLEIEHRPGLFQARNRTAFGRLGTMEDTAAWVLVYSTETMQRWFASREVPCLVFGRCHEGIAMPCAYPDAEASARHAAGLFYARGHRTLAYFMDEFTSLGDRLGAAAFEAEGLRLGARVRVITHTRESGSVCAGLRGLLAERPMPTAFFSSCPEHCVTALCLFQSLGYRVPDELCLIAGWDDSTLDFTVPEIARYRVDGTKMGRMLGKMTLEAIRLGTARKAIKRVVVPDYVPGGSMILKTANGCQPTRIGSETQ